MDEVADDGALDAVPLGGIDNRLKLLRPTVDQYYPVSLLPWVTAQGFAKSLVDDLSHLASDTCPDSPVGWPWALRAPIGRTNRIDAMSPMISSAVRI
jgi:hypothetical protein